MFGRLQVWYFKWHQLEGNARRAHLFYWSLCRNVEYFSHSVQQERLHHTLQMQTSNEHFRMFDEHQTAENITEMRLKCPSGSVRKAAPWINKQLEADGLCYEWKVFLTPPAVLFDSSLPPSCMTCWSCHHQGGCVYLSLLQVPSFCQTDSTVLSTGFPVE